MHYDVVVCLALPLVALPLSRAALVALHPRHAARLMAAAAVALAACSWAALGLLLLGAVAWEDISSDAPARPHRALLLREFTAPPVAAVAAAALGIAGLATLDYVGRWVRGMSASAAHAGSLPGADRVVVTSNQNADAYAVPGRPGRIVVSAGMLSALDVGGRHALLAHEHAHLNHRHHVYAGVVRFAAAANPLVRPLARAVDYSLERWADEEAARAAGCRRTVAEAISKAAVASKRNPVPARPSAALAMLSGLAWASRRPGPIPRRVAALLKPAPTTNRWAVLAALATVAASALCFVEAAVDFNELLRCVPGALT